MSLIRPCWKAGSTPQPDCTAMYCTPSTSKDDGGAMMPELVLNCHSCSPVLRVERPEHAVVGAAVEHQAAARGQQRAPVHHRIEMGPFLLAGVDVPRLDLAVGLGVLVDREADVRDVDAGPPLAGARTPGPCLPASRRGCRWPGCRPCRCSGCRPRAASPCRPTATGRTRRTCRCPACGRRCSRPAGLGVDAREHVLLDVVGRVDVADRPSGERSSQYR